MGVVKISSAGVVDSQVGENQLRRLYPFQVILGQT